LEPEDEVPPPEPDEPDELDLPDEPDEPDEPDDPESLDELDRPESELPDSDEAAFSLDAELPSPDAELPSPDALAADDDFDLAALPRSFLAQPDPLKWIVGGANSLRIVPSSPQDGQNSGPGSFRPWRMSVRWSQAVQAYS
jgi:hypothetical protein